MTSEAIAQVSALINAGQPVQAEQLSRTALQVYPNEETLLVLLAVSLQMQQRSVEALSIYAELTRLYPMSSVHWGNYGTVLFEAGSVAKAEQAYRKATQLDPGNAFPKLHWGMLMIQQRDYVAARHMLLDAFQLDRDSPLVRVHAAKACCLCQDFQGGADLLKPWRQWLPLNDDALQLELAQVLTLQYQVPEAGELLEDLLSRQPQNVEARLLLATIYERENRLADAEALAVSTLAITSSVQADLHNEAQHILATLAIRRKDFAGARELLEHAGPQGVDDYSHYFELAAVCDKLGDTDATMRALKEAHKLATLDFRIASPELFAENAPPMPGRELPVSLDQYEHWPKLIAPDMQDSPIFVVGFPRSGTTLLEQMLDAHPGLQSMDENPFFNRLADLLRSHNPRILEDLSVLQQYDVDELRKRYHAMVAERIQRRPGTRLVDKNPLNMHWLPLIYRLFPEAKFILALRHPCDVILSCYMQNFRSSILAAACTSLERLAHGYVHVMTDWLEDASVLKPDVMLSRYEDLVSDFPQQTARIASFLALDDAAPMLRFDQHASSKNYIGTPSYSQVVEPVNRKAMGRWQKYRREMEPVLPILEPMLRHWGYDTDVT